MGWIQRLVAVFAAPHEYGGQRSPKWNRVRDDFLRKHRDCTACGSGLDLEVHHVVPYHQRRDLELVESNLLVLCRDCHFYFGHLKDWTSYNESVRTDAANYRQKIRQRP